MIVAAVTWPAGLKGGQAEVKDGPGRWVGRWTHRYVGGQADGWMGGISRGEIKVSSVCIGRVMQPRVDSETTDGLK